MSAKVPIIAIVVFVIVAGALLSWHFSDHQVAVRGVRASFENISASANAQNKDQLFAKLNQYFQKDADIDLSVKFRIFGIGSQGPRDLEFNFHSMADFNAFINNMIGKVNTYGMNFDVANLVVDEADSSKIKAVVSASGFATGVSLMMGKSVGTRFIIRSDCTLEGTYAGSLSIATFNCPVMLNQQADLQDKNLREAVQELRNLKP